MEQLHNVYEFHRTLVPQKIFHKVSRSIESKAFVKIDESHEEGAILLLFFFLHLSGCKDNVSSAPLGPEATLRFWKKFLGKWKQPLKQDASDDLAHGRQSGDVLVVPIL